MWGQVPKKVFCQELHEMSQFAQKSFLPMPIPMGWVLGRGTIFHRFFLLWYWIIFQICTENHLSNLLPLWGWGRGRGSISKKFLLRIDWYVQIFTEMACLPTLHPMGTAVEVWAKVPKDSSFAKNCMKCLAQKRKVMFSNPNSYWYGFKLLKTIFLVIKGNVKICTEKSSSPNPHPMAGGSVSQKMLPGIAWYVQTCIEKSYLPTPQPHKHCSGMRG